MACASVSATRATRLVRTASESMASESLAGSCDLVESRHLAMSSIMCVSEWS